MGTLLHDLSYSFRVLRRNPGFTLVAIGVLALGIGLNSAIFSIVNAVLLRPLPYPDPDSLVRVIFSNPGVGLHDIGFSALELDDLKRESGVFEDVSVVWGSSVNMMAAQHPERLELLAVSPSYFSMLRLTPQLGRLFGPEDVTPGYADAVVISDSLWNRQFGRDPAILGRKILFDNDVYTVAGVLPPGFRHPGRTVANDVEVWAACGFGGDPYPKPARNVRFPGPTIGRLKPGVTLAQAQERLNALAAELRREYPNDYPAAARWSIEIQPLRDSLVGSVRTLLVLLMGAAGLVVLIGCVNVANLLLARASARQQEIAVRLALGAGPARIIRQMLTEALVLSLGAGLIGVLIALGVSGPLLRLAPSWIPRRNEIGVDWTVLGFAFLVSVLTGVLFGLVPAMQSAKTNFFFATREAARGSSAKTGRGGQVLIISELALAMVLMVGAGLLLRTFWSVLNENPGFNPSSVVTASFWLSHPNAPSSDLYPDARSQAVFIRDVLLRVRQIPGIDLAGMTTSLPVTTRAAQADVVVEEHAIESSQGFSAEIIGVSPDYFKLMQAGLVTGRFFVENDEVGKQEVAIVDENTARRFWPGEDPINRRMRLGRSGTLRSATPDVPWLTVVGVVKNIKHDGLDVDGISHVYRSIYQHPSRAMSLVLRTPLQPTSLSPQIRRVIEEVDPRLPVFGVRSMDEVIDASLGPRRFSAVLVGSFALLAVLLASFGIYGLLAYMVGRRVREIGIRVALGATSADILKLVLGRAALLAVVGTLVGLLLAALAAPLLGALLWSIHPLDPLVFAAVPLLLLGVSLLASYIPARRASKVQPAIALRDV